MEVSPATPQTSNVLTLQEVDLFLYVKPVSLLFFPPLLLELKHFSSLADESLPEFAPFTSGRLAVVILYNYSHLWTVTSWLLFGCWASVLGRHAVDVHQTIFLVQKLVPNEIPQWRFMSLIPII